METYKYNIKDLDGKPVPDYKITSTLRDMLESTGNYDDDVKKGVYAYNYNGTRAPLKNINLDKCLVKFISGLWRYRRKSQKSYKIINVYDKRLVLGDKIDIAERDEFNFEYYFASEVRYDMFGVLTPQFDMYISKCNTTKGPMLRYGISREEARAFLRGSIMDDKDYAPRIATMVLDKKSKRSR